jgi:hypothetical protein
MQTGVRYVAAVAITLSAAVASPSFGADAAIDPETVAAFAAYNLAQMADGQVYVGAPNVRAIGEWIDGNRVRKNVEKATVGGFVDGPPGPDVILISRAPENFADTFAAFSHEMTNRGFDETEVMTMWSVMLVSRGGCNVGYPRDYMAVISVDPFVDVTTCVSQGIYWFRGIRMPFHEFASVEPSAATRQVDDRLAGALRDCAPLGWLDATVRECVTSRFKVKAEEPDLTADAATRRYSLSLPNAALSRAS